MNVQGDAESGHERAERKVRGVLRGLLVPVALALELELVAARRTSGDAEVVDTPDEPFAEEVLPDSIGEHARSERILQVGQPLGEFEPTALGRARPYATR